MSRTVDQRKNEVGFPKAGELIDIRPSQELTLQDRRVFNILIENAGPRISEEIWHEIPMFKLRGPTHKGNERISDSIFRLMTTVVEVPCAHINGLAAVRTTVLLSENMRTVIEDNPHSMLHYKLTETLRTIICQSQYWGRIKSHVMFAFSSKYAMILYESLCLRINLRTDCQEFSVDQFRALLDVKSGKLAAFPQFKQKAITPAVLEVNALSDFVVTVEPIRAAGRARGSLEGFRLSWRRKTKEEWSETLMELLRASTGRKARISGTVDQLAT